MKPKSGFVIREQKAGKYIEFNKVRGDMENDLKETISAVFLFLFNYILSFNIKVI